MEKGNRRKRAAGYVRVSSDRQEISLEAQRAKLAQYAELYDVEIVAWCSDEGVSGARRNRPGLRRALKMLRDCKADALLVFKLDRLTRSLGHLTELLQTYFSNGRWALLSVTEQLDTKTASGRMVINVLGAVNQWYREDVGEKTALALQHKKTKGEKTGGDAPFGYRAVVGDNGTKRLELDPKEAPTLTRIESWRKQGLGIRRITRCLNEGGISARGKRWHKTTVQRILRRVHTERGGARIAHRSKDS